MENRDRIIRAAAFVYAKYGFRGATTRRIAEAAGVNEITLFRQFGSKEALIDEALAQMSADPAALPALPAEPADPEAELTAWCEVHLAHLRANRSMIRKTMGELEERPGGAPCAARPNTVAGAELKRYMGALYGRRMIAGPCPQEDAEVDREAHAAGAMLMAALFGDAMGREMMPDLYPQPASGAAALYVRLFLRAIGAVPRAAAAPARKSRTAPSKATVTGAAKAGAACVAATLAKAATAAGVTRSRRQAGAVDAPRPKAPKLSPASGRRHTS